MDIQQSLELYKESLKSVLTCLQEEKCSAEKFKKLEDLQKKIHKTAREDTAYTDFVNTSKLVRGQLDRHVRKVDDYRLVLNRIWEIRRKHGSKIKTKSIKLKTEEDNSQYNKHIKIIIALEKMMESIEEMDDTPVKSPDDATTSQAISQERKGTEKHQQSADLHKEDSVDEDKQDVVIGDNSNPICQQPTNEKEEEDKEPKNEDVKGDESKRREELYKTKTELDEMTKVHNSQKEEENGMINELEKLRNENDRLEAKVKKLMEMNTGFQDENERYKMYEKEYNKLTEENTAHQQSMKAYDIYISKLKDENTGLEQRLDRLQSPISVQVKELQKRIDIKTAENESLTKRLKSQEKYMKEAERSGQRPQRPQTAPHAGGRQYKELQNQIATLTAEKESLMERLQRPQTAPHAGGRQHKELQNQIATLTDEKESLMQRLQRPQTAPHAGGRQYKELQNQIATLTDEKESLMQRLSMVAGMKMRDNNPGIADLSDPNRPEKLAEQFREIYDNAWTNLLDYITENTDTTDDIAVQLIVAVTQKIFEQCQNEVGKMKRLLLRIIGYPEDTFEKQYTGGKAGHDPIVKMMKDLVQISAEGTYERVLEKIKEIREIKKILQDDGKSGDVFLTKCSKLCLFMCVKDPPVVLDFNFKRGDLFDKDKLSAFTTSGDIVDYLVWPVMYLHENGPVMSKGVAQGRKK